MKIDKKYGFVRKLCYKISLSDQLGPKIQEKSLKNLKHKHFKQNQEITIKFATIFSLDVHSLSISKHRSFYYNLILYSASYKHL